MKILNIIAIYRGPDLKCDYKKGEEYMLIVHERPTGRVQIENINGCGLCFYNSMKHLYEDWTNIRKIKKLKND